MQHKRGAGVIADLSLIGNAKKENEQGAVSCRSERRRWTVKTETRAVGRYTDRVRAIAAAIDLANAAARAGRCAANHIELRKRFASVQPGQAEKHPHPRHLWNVINSAIDKPRRSRSVC
jgi:hypothetical protein